MSIPSNALVFGLTGSIGSGCTTLKEALEKVGYVSTSCSIPVHKKWKEENPDKNPEHAPRNELQNIGDRLRQEKGNGILAIESLKEISKSPNKVIFDSIRHPGEIAFLRNKFPNFFLIAVDCPEDERWERLKLQYDNNRSDFETDDDRDKNEDLDYGQQVQLCVDDADILISNNEHFVPKYKQKEALQKKIDDYLGLINGREIRLPHPEESMMALAYANALNSTCYKRQVGAVIVNRSNFILGVGCNENPKPLGSCEDEFGECYKDIFKKNALENMGNVTCPNPKCAKPIKNNFLPNFKCKSCGESLDKHFIPDRAASRCTALHAEETAIINTVGRNLEGCTIYTTTFPCFLCAQKIIVSGIDKIVYCESYPDAESKELFNRVNNIIKLEKDSPNHKNEIDLHKFQGVKARAYFRFFGSARWQKEESIKKKKEESEKNG